MKQSDLQRVEEKIDKLAIGLRDSAPPSLSHVIIDLKNEFQRGHEELNGKIDNLVEYVKPSVDAYDAVVGTKKTLLTTAKIGVALSSIYAVILAIKHYLKN